MNVRNLLTWIRKALGMVLAGWHAVFTDILLGLWAGDCAYAFAWINRRPCNQV